MHKQTNTATMYFAIPFYKKETAYGFCFVFPSPFLQKGNRLRILLAKTKRHVFFFSLFTKGKQIKDFVLYFFSPFLQKEDRLRLLLAKNKRHVFSLSLFTKGRQLTAFACKSRKQRDFNQKLAQATKKYKKKTN
jgi:hypothetical protein